MTFEKLRRYGFMSSNDKIDHVRWRRPPPYLENLEDGTSPVKRGKLEIAQSIIHNPRFLFLAEPLSGKNRAEAFNVHLSPHPLTHPQVISQRARLPHNPFFPCGQRFA